MELKTGKTNVCLSYTQEVQYAHHVDMDIVDYESYQRVVNEKINGKEEKKIMEHLVGKYGDPKEEIDWELDVSSVEIERTVVDE